jgi:hypothetical protein
VLPQIECKELNPASLLQFLASRPSLAQTFSHSCAKRILLPNLVVVC